uniref:Putative Protease inhibitor n=1 Tax=Megacormus gertschi TaxID=1843536 RepID=A0A224XGQ2_9SCOR
MLRMTTSKDHSLLEDTEWDVTVKKKPIIWKKWVRCSLFTFLILLALAVTALFVFGFIYRRDFMGFIKMKPFEKPISQGLIEEHIHAGAARMAVRLFNRANSDKNSVWSPLTVALGLGLLLEGTTGPTAFEIESAMGWTGIDRTHVRSHISRAITRLNNLHGLNVIIANRMFLHNSFHVASRYKNILSENYQVTIDQVDFTHSDALESINKWGLEESRGKIKELIPSGAIDATTKMVLSTFLTFDGKWKVPFSPNRTQKSDFTSEDGKRRRVDMMYQNGKFMYGEFPAHGFTALELPYSEPNVSMMVLLPQSLPLLKATLEEQDGKMLIGIRGKMKRIGVDVCLPKFTVETGQTMERHLSSLGIKRLFSPSSANLELISPNSELYVQKIIHRVKIQVVESGTSGHASSSSVLQGRSLIASFCADRPFLFYVEDKEANSLLFWGEYNGSE